jgi:uncharacterized protein
MLKILVALFIFFAVGNVFGQNGTDDEARAKAFINALAKKDFAAAYDFFADEVKAKIPAEAMPQIWAQITGEYGEFRSIKELKKAADGRSLVARLEFEKKPESFIVAFNEQGKIVGFIVAPPDKSASAEAKKYEPPKYADLNSFTETEVTVGAGEWALPATLTMPKGKTNVPAVVLVHGSGPHDRDETIGNNKVFKDLAWGLASKGIAVLRYEKRSRQYGAKLAAVKNFTVNEETVDDAVLAARLLMKMPNVNPKKVFILGHSLGGYLIPRIAEKEKAIAGFISFAGATRPLADVLPEQYAYIFSLDGAISPAEQAQIDEVKKIAAKIKSLKESDRGSGEFYFGAPASYYLDLQNYNPPQSAAKLKQPMLILQGERDYQVTMQDFANWKNALVSKENVVFKSYPNLTHTFMETSGGKPGPQDYEKASHVNETVINDIANWILKTAKR